MFRIPGIRVHDALESLFTFEWNPRSRCPGIPRSMLETVVRRAFRRTERLFALDAPVATAFPGSRPVESVPNDVPGAGFSLRTTFGVETAQTFHSRAPCRRKNYVRRNQAQTLAHRLVRAWPATLDCGSTVWRRCCSGRGWKVKRDIPLIRLSFRAKPCRIAPRGKGKGQAAHVVREGTARPLSPAGSVPDAPCTRACARAPGLN